MEKGESSLLSKKLLKHAMLDNARMSNIGRKILMLESMSDNKMNNHITQYDLLMKAKQLNKNYLEKDFLKIDETLDYVDTVMKFVNLYTQSVKNIVDEILNVFYNLNASLISENDYDKITITINKCVSEIDNIIDKAYYDGTHLMYLTGVDKTTTLTYRIFESDNLELNKIIDKNVPDGLEFTFCLPVVDTISLGLFGYTLEPSFSYKKMEFIAFEKITNMEKYINRHIQKFNIAYDKIVAEEKMIESFNEILRLKKELFYANKSNIISEYFKKDKEV